MTRAYAAAPSHLRHEQVRLDGAGPLCIVGLMVQVVNDSVALANELRPILLRLARHLRNETHTRGVTGGQVSLLVAIEFHPGITAQQLAEREGLSAPGVSGHLARLEGLGMIRRQRTSDRRRVGLFVT